MRGGDGFDYRQAEAAAAADRGVGGAFAADEAIKDLLAQLQWNAGAVVGDLDDRVGALGP